jgi:hypothetical protein
MPDANSTTPELHLPTFYGKHSLRTIAPDHWALDGKALFFYSLIAAHAYGPIENKISEELAQFIKENWRSAHRLRIMAISAYESFASFRTLPSWKTIGTMSFIALTAGVSTLDALACILWGILFGEVPKGEKDIPSMKLLRTELSKRKHPFLTPVVALLEADWCQLLYEGRNRVVHRGFWPVVGEMENFVLCQELEKFAFGPKSGPPERKTQPLDLVQIMRGLLCELEMWEIGLEPLLKANRKFTPYSDGDRIQSQIDGSAESDWLLDFHFTNHKPTDELMNEWKKHQEP